MTRRINVNRPLSSLAFVCLVVATAHAQLKPTPMVVKITGLDGNDKYQVMTSTELKALEKRIRDESRYFRKALDNAKKAWEADESHEKIRFPSSAVRVRKARMMGRFKSNEDAQEKLLVYEERLAESEKKAAEKEKERANRALKRARSKQAKEKMMEKVKEAESEKAEKEALRKEAEDLFEAELDKLLPPAEAAADE